MKMLRGSRKGKKNTKVKIFAFVCLSVILLGVLSISVFCESAEVIAMPEGFENVKDALPEDALDSLPEGMLSQNAQEQGEALSEMISPKHAFDLLRDLIGAEIGSTVDLNLTFPSDYGNTELAGKPVVFTVTVNYVERSFSELTEENVNTSEEIISTMPSLEIGKTSVNQPMENNNGVNDEKVVLSNGYVPNEWRAIAISSIFIISLIGLAFYLVKSKASK